MAMVGADAGASHPHHLPVMRAQVLHGLRVRSDGKYVDGTFGRGGHARDVLDRLGPGGRLLVIDKDPEAIVVANALAREDARVAVFQGSFADLVQCGDATSAVDGVLLDLGVSSPQLDRGERGFSFRLDGPLDMRMNPEQGQSAAQWLATADEREIADVLWLYGEERASRRIAKTIVARRAEQPITRTLELAEIISSVLGRGDGQIHPATRSFQAIRIYINRELDDLQQGLAAAYSALAVGGRLVVISFHSLEDRIVKQFIHERAKPPAGNRRLPVAVEFSPTLKEIDGAQRAASDELVKNPRARSAVLRVAEKLAAQVRA